MIVHNRIKYFIQLTILQIARYGYEYSRLVSFTKHTKKGEFIRDFSGFWNRGSFLFNGGNVRLKRMKNAIKNGICIKKSQDEKQGRNHFAIVTVNCYILKCIFTIAISFKSNLTYFRSVNRGLFYLLNYDFG